MNLKASINSLITKRLRTFPRGRALIVAFILLAVAASALVVVRGRAASLKSGGTASRNVLANRAAEPEAHSDVLRRSREGRSTGEGSLSWLSDPRSYAHGGNVFSRVFASRTARTLSPAPAPSTIGNTISGTVFDLNGNPITTGRTIKLIQNGTLSGTTATSDGSGIYTFTGLTLLNGDKITVYIGGGAAEKGATFTFSGTSDITTLNIFQNQLVVRSDNGTVVTNSDLKSAQGASPEADLLSVDNINPSNILMTAPGFGLQIWSGTTYAPAGDINNGGNWINNGTFTAGSNIVTFSGTNNQTITGLNSTTFNNLIIANTGPDPNNVVSLDGSGGATNTVAATLTVSNGVFDQGSGGASSNLSLTGTGDVATITSSGTWQNLGTGDITLNGDISNNGLLEINANGKPCGQNDDILIQSSASGTQRTWKGTGTFSMTDVEVQDQKVPGGATLPLKILVSSGTDHPGTNLGWTFGSSCTGPYTWQGGANNRWVKPQCWSPSRSDAADSTTNDVLIFDGSVTASPVIDEVPNQTNNAIHLTNGVLVTLSEPELGSSTLELHGATGQDLDVPVGTLLTLAGSLPFTIQLTASGHQAEVAGQILMKDGGHQLIGDNAGEITVTGGVTIASTYSATTRPFGTGTNGSVVFESGSTGTFNRGLDPFGGVGHAVVTFQSDSTASFFSAPAFFGDGGTYGNLILDGDAQSYFLHGSNPTTVLNNFRLGQGNSFVFSSTPGGDMNLFGNFRDETVLAGQFNANGRTIKFQGATQTVFFAGALGTFSDVSIAQTTGGKVQLLTSTRITGQLNLTNADSLLELNGHMLQLEGTVTGAGNLKGDPIASMVVLGPVGLDLGTVNFVSGGRTLSSLQLNRINASMTLGTDLALAGNLRLDDGILNTGLNTLSLSPTSSVSRTNGYVVGNLQKSFGASGNLGSFTFPLGTANAYSPLDANVTANTSGTLTAKAVQGKQPNIPGANALQRYWTLNGSGITADLTFHYSTSNSVPPTNDVVGTEANYKIIKYNGSFTQFTPDATGSNSATDHFATKNGVSSFSDWTLADPTAEIPGTLQFSATNFNDTELNSSSHTATITVTRTGGSAGAASVHWATSAGTATAGGDYTEASGDLNWIDGDAASKQFTVTVFGDTTYEANETVNLTLSAATGATLGSPNSATLTIVNDDNPPASLVVNTNDDQDFGACLPSPGHCSLREAINAANAVSDASTINFNIAGAGVHTITPATALPAITQPVTIDGYSQTGASANTSASGDNAVLLIVLSGVTVGTGSDGLTISAGSSTVKGLAINGGFGSAIVLSTNGGNTITGNFIGTDAAGTGAAANLNGIQVTSASNFIGGTNAADHNVVIAQSTGAGILVNGSGANSNTIQGNHVGTNAAGTAQLGTTGTGIRVDTNTNTIGGTTGTTAGGACTGACNLASGNTNSGIAVFDTAGGAGNTIQGNFVGTNAAGTAAIGNGSEGVRLQTIGTLNVLGGTTAAARNVISGNAGIGIVVQGADQTTIQGNYIGVDTPGAALGNGASPGHQGIALSASNCTVGGLAVGSGNIVANNNGAGILVISGINNSIRGNSIFNNARLGIDLAGGAEDANGVTANDAKDLDTGPNNLQDSPVLTSAFVGGTSVGGTLNSNVGATFTIDVYANDACDLSGDGEGKTYLGSVTTGTTDINGDVSFTVTVPALVAGEPLTATATDTGGNTSEFSLCFTPLVGQTISGTVFTTNSAGTMPAGRTITLLQNGISAGTGTTDASGNYSISAVTLVSGDKLAVFIDNASEKGAAVTLSGTSSISNLNIIQNALIVRTDNGGTITNANLSSAQGGAPDADLTAVYTIATGNLTTLAGVSLELGTGSNYAPGGNITDGGNWTNNGTFTNGGFTVTFNGTANQSISGSTSTAFATLAISNTGAGGSNTVSLSQNISDTALNVTSGIFDQGASSNVNSGAVTVSSGATWRNVGTGDLVLSGGVSNSGTINFNANGNGCPQNDDISITSSSAGTQRAWSGAGSFNITDVAVQDQGGTAIIGVRSGTSVSGNGANWLFVSQCSAYTWSQAVSTDWTNALNWSPTRTTVAPTDILIFGAGTPIPTATNVAGIAGGTNETIAELHVANGVLPTFSTGTGANTLTIDTGSGAVGFDVYGLTITGANALTIKLATTGAGTLGTIAGPMIVNSGAHRLIGQAVSAITLQNGSTFRTDTGFTGNVFGDGSSAANGAAGSVVFSNGSTYFHNAGGSPFGASGNPSVVTFQTGSEADYLIAGGFDASGRTYANLVIGDGTNTVNASQSGTGSFQFDNLTVKSNGTTNSSIAYAGSGSSAVTIQGNIQSTGTGAGSAADVTLTAGSGGIQINKSGGGTLTFSNSGNTRSIDFESDATLNSATTLNLGRIVQMGISPTHVFTANGTVTPNQGAPGYILGSEKKTFSAAGSKTFEVGTVNGYSPVDVNATTGTFAADFTVNAKQGQLPSIHGVGVNALQRYWTISGPAPGIVTANLTFHYLAGAPPAGDIVGTPANYVFFKRSATNVLTTLSPASPPTSTIAGINGISSFSDWTLAEPSAVTPGTLTFVGAPYSDSETNANHNKIITVRRSGGSDGVVSVHYATSAGSATAGIDYTETSGDLTWTDGDTADKTFDVPIIGDTSFEPNETVNLTLSAATGGATIGAPNPTTLTITDDDTGDTNVSMSGGDLIISDASGGTTDDTLTISRNSSSVRINDPNHTLSCGAGTNTVDTHTCEVVFSTITGNIQVNTLGGDDSLTVALAGGDCIPTGGLSYNGGTQTTSDKLFITGGSQGTVTYNYTNANDGSIVIQNYGTVTYTGLEPISNSGTATDVIFNLPAAANVATLSDLGSGNSRLASTGTFEQTDFTNPSGSVTITGGTLNDSISVGALAANYPSLTINGNQGNDTVNFTGSTTFGAAASLDVNLQNDNASPGIDNVIVNGELIVSGTNTIDVRASEAIKVNSGGKLQVANGGLTVEANQQVTSTATNHHGVEVNGGTIQSTGAGNISIKGRGGEGSFDRMYGVIVWNGGKVLSTATGTITVEGTGGARTGGAPTVQPNTSELFGVYVYLVGSEISSTSGAITITGTGGATNDTGSAGVEVAGGKIQQSGAGALIINGTGGTCTGGSSAFLNSIGVGVRPDDAPTPAGGIVTSTGAGVNAGNVSITGIAGNGGNGGAQGVRVDDPGTVTSVDGSITFIGTGAACGNACLGASIRGVVTATGTGAISITGTGANSTGAFSTHGVNVRSGGAVTAKDGNITITGTGGNGADNAGFNLAPLGTPGTGTLQTTGTGSIFINADIITIQTTASATIDAGAHAVSLRQKTNTLPINLGSTVDTTAGTVELSNAELGRVTSGSLNIGDNNSGAITVSADITRAASTNMSLTSGSDIIISGGQINTGGGTLLLDCGNSPAAVKPTRSGTDVTASTLSFGSDLAIVINGTAVDSQYTQLNVSGNVNLTGVGLVLSGSPTLVGGEAFTIVNNAGSNAITGTFNGLAEGATIANFLNSGLPAAITYHGGTGSNDVILTVASPPCPTSFTVDDVGDDPDSNAGDGLCKTSGNKCTLRAAIMEANGLTSCGTIDINFSLSLPNTIILGSALDTIGHNVNINGPGANQLSIDGAGTYRIFIIGSGRTVSVDGLDLGNGFATGVGENGAGIFNNGSLTVTNSIIAGNQTPNSGAGIYNNGGTVAIKGSTFVGQNDLTSGATQNGGAIYNNGTVTSATVNIVNSTFNGNFADNSGGAIVNDGVSATMTITNSTISGNGTFGDAGGILNNGGTVNLRNTVVGDNFSIGSDHQDVFGPFVSLGHNLISVSDGSTGFGSSGDQVGTSAAPLNPGLGFLDNNGGTTPTMALAGGSPAIDAGDDCVLSACSPIVTTDQRGVTRPQGAHVDIGAYEMATYVVNTTADHAPDVCEALSPGHDCTLREAIDAANLSPGSRIVFAIPTGVGGDAGCDVNAVCTISPTLVLGNLPSIPDAVFIDGYSQPGASQNTKHLNEGDDAVLKIVLDGGNITTGGRGLDLVCCGGGSMIRGLAIDHWTEAGIAIADNSDNTIAGNFIGVDVAGTTSAGSAGASGILITGESSVNNIGGDTPDLRNIISGNGNGIVLDGEFTTDTVVEGNYIGTNRNGTAIPTGAGSSIGVKIQNGSNFNTIGCEVLDGDNIISGNTNSGVRIEGDPSCCGGSANYVQGNLIGTDRTGAAAVPNGIGVVIIDSTENSVGVNFSGTFGNLISGNTGDGVLVRDSTVSGNFLDNFVQSNLIGTNAAGTAALPNGGAGVELDGAAGNLIGGATTNDGNVISGNTGDGVEITGGASTNDVQGNFIGVAANGTTLLGNGGSGVEIYTVVTTAGSSDNFIGRVSETVGDKARLGSAKRTVNRGERKPVARHRRSGKLASVPARFANLVKSRAPKSRSVGGQRFIIVPSTSVIAGSNIIAGNGVDGVRISNAGDVNNLVTQNSIHSNTGLGINLGTDTVTPNDPDANLDSDDGPNHLQNFPIIQTARADTQTITGILHSAAGSDYTIEFYANPSCDGSGNGEGKTFIGSTSPSSDASGNASFSFTALPGSFAAGNVITATATDIDNNTSEFSQCFTALAGAQPTTTTITNTAALAIASTVGNPYEVDWSVTPSVSGTPTGTVSVTGDGAGCSAAVSVGKCFITPTTAGVKSLVAHYGGDPDFSPSDSAPPVSHTVNDPVCTPPPPGLAAWYPGEGNANDISGNGNHGVLQNGAGFAAGKVGQAFNLNGTNQFVEAPDAPANSMTAAITIDAWIQTNALSDQAIVSKYDTTLGSTSVSYLLAMAPDGRIVWTVYQGSGSHGVQTDNPVITPGAPIHLAGTFNTSDQAMKIYINGVDTPASVLGGSTTVSLINDTNVPLRIGAAKSVSSSGLTSFFNGLIDEVELFSRALDAAEIADLYNAGSAGKCQSSTISGHVDYCITPTANVPNVTISVTGSQATSTTTDATGNYSLTLPVGGNYTLTPTKGALSPAAPGIDTVDALSAQSHYVGSTTLTGCSLLAADVTENSVVDTVDAIAIQRFFVGLNTGIASAGQYRFTPANRAYSNLAVAQTGQNFDAVVLGDINGNLTPTKVRLEVARDAAGANVTGPSSVATVSLPVANVSTNVTNFTQPVTTSTISAGDNLVGFQGDFTFDSTVVTFQTPPVTGAGLTGGAGWSVTGNVLGAGTIKTLRVSAFTTDFGTPLSGSGTLFNLKLTRVSNTVGANTPLIWAASPNNFVFIAANLSTQAPGSTPDGSITIVGPSASSGEVSGHIVDANGNPVEGAAVRMNGTQNRLTVTDASGNYTFANVETNGFYTVTPSRANFNFSPAQRSFSQLGLHTEAAFTGAANSDTQNPLDRSEYFVRQQYLDFLNREPDEAGFNFWVNNIESCGADAQCREVKRIDTSAAFFLSIEFQQTGYLVYRTYHAAFGDLANTPVPLRLSEFQPDTRAISKGVIVTQGDWEQTIENNKQEFMATFVGRSRFVSAYPTTLTPTEFVDRLFADAGVVPSGAARDAAIGEFATATTTSDTAGRARALRRVAENSALGQKDFDSAFVLMQYFGYLRRDADAAPDTNFDGYNFWLTKLNTFKGNYQQAELVKAFLSSIEYRGRFPR